MDKEELLKEQALGLSDNPKVVEFLTTFMDVEEQHINKFLSKDDFNLRNANLCAEAYSVARLMLNMIEGKD